MGSFKEYFGKEIKLCLFGVISRDVEEKSV